LTILLPPVLPKPLARKIRSWIEEKQPTFAQWWNRWGATLESHNPELAKHIRKYYGYIKSEMEKLSEALQSITSKEKQRIYGYSFKPETIQRRSVQPLSPTTKNMKNFMLGQYVHKDLNFRFFSRLVDEK